MFFFFLINIVCQELNFDSTPENIPLNVTFSYESLSIRTCYIFDMLFEIFYFLLKKDVNLHVPLTPDLPHSAAVNKHWISSSEGQP